MCIKSARKLNVILQPFHFGSEKENVCPILFDDAEIFSTAIYYTVLSTTYISFSGDNELAQSARARAHTLTKSLVPSKRKMCMFCVGCSLAISETI